MKRLAKVFLSFVLVLMCSFSFIGCAGGENGNNNGGNSNVNSGNGNTNGGGSAVSLDGIYYFNSEYLYEIADPSSKLVNCEFYGDYYGTSINIQNNQFDFEFDGDEFTFKLVKDGDRYILEEVDSDDDNDSDRLPGTGGIPSTVRGSISSASYGSKTGDVDEVSQNPYAEYSNGGLLITLPFDEEEAMVLEYLKDESKVTRYDYRLYKTEVDYYDGGTSTKTKETYNDFINLNRNTLTNYDRGDEYRYSMTQDGDTYILELLTESEYASYETATLEILEDELVISYSEDGYGDVTLTYKKL